MPEDLKIRTAKAYQNLQLKINYKSITNVVFYYVILSIIK